MPEHGQPHQVGARLRLLGLWRLTHNDNDIHLDHREQRLTALLGLNGRRMRLQVAGTLWPESTDERALASLRRAVLHTQRRSPGVLVADRTTVGLDPAVQVDLDEFKESARTITHDTRKGVGSRAAAILESDTLLPGWYDDWLVLERERLEQLRLRALERLARHALEQGDLDLAIEAATAAKRVEPLLEPAREISIRAHLAQGNLLGAAREFHNYRDSLWSELGVAPSTVLHDLVAPALRAGTGIPGPAFAPGAPLPRRTGTAATTAVRRREDRS